MPENNDPVDPAPAQIVDPPRLFGRQTFHLKFSQILALFAISSLCGFLGLLLLKAQSPWLRQIAQSLGDALGEMLKIGAYGIGHATSYALFGAIIIIPFWMITRIGAQIWRRFKPAPTPQPPAPGNKAGPRRQ